MVQPNCILPQSLVFPVKRNGKTPLTDHGFHDASSNPEQITRWTRELPGSNWGAPTGQVSGFVVLDIDPKHPGSLEWWWSQQDIHGSVNTCEVATPSGGAHIYFQAPEGIALKSTASQIAPGVDTRADGGYVVVPPSVIDGNPYEVVNDAPVAPLPDWLLAVWPKIGEIRRRQFPRPHQGTPAAGGLLHRPLPDGYRNTGLARIAGYLWNHCSSVEELEVQLLEANERLCQPPKPEDEVLGIARSISRYPQTGTTPGRTRAWRVKGGYLKVAVRV
jgi:putative DNA primase/helicase